MRSLFLKALSYFLYSIFTLFLCTGQGYAFDYGDAPTDLSAIDGSMGNIYGDAWHQIDPAVYLGSLVDSDTGSQNTGTQADGDDTDGSNDDDGVVFDLLGGTRVLRVDNTNNYTVRASTSGFLNAWIDWNQDGDWNDSGEQIATNIALNAGANALDVAVSAGAPQGTTYARFRFTSTSVSNPSPLGLLNDGEVEDYAVHLLNPPAADICDTVVTNGYMETGPFPGSYTATSETNIEGWATIPVDPNTGNFASRNKIELWSSGFLGVEAFEGNYFVELNASVAGMLYQDVSLVPGSTYRWKLAHRGRGGVDTMNILMGAPGAEVLQRSVSTGKTAWVQYSGEYTVPAGEFITRFGFQATNGGGTGNFLDAISIPGGCDFGDAPDSYGTLIESNGAYHISNNTLALGAIGGDPESTGKPTIGADGDDADADSDEDSVTNLNPMYFKDTSYTVGVVVTNNTTTAANVVAWVDFDSNGTFDENESTSATVPAGTNLGTVTLNWPELPLDRLLGQTYMRVRLTTLPISGLDSVGAFASGEVEDYVILDATEVSGRVYNDTNTNATFDSGEQGVPGTVVVLLDKSTGTCRSQVTNGAGMYSFVEVLNGSYQIYQAYGETTPVPQNCGVAWMKNPAGFQSTSPDSLEIVMSDADVLEQNFGEVQGSIEAALPGNTFTPDHQGVITPGGTVRYAHVFTATGDVSVTFEASGSSNTTSGWSSTLYNDSNCNGVLEGNEMDISINGTPINDVLAGDKICLINQVMAPSGVLTREQYLSEVVAEFVYAGGSLPTGTLAVHDLTVVSVSSGGSLVLEKKVANLTQGGVYTLTTNQAKPGDELHYRLFFSNPGLDSITDVIINDTAPPFTSYVSGSALCDSTPAGMVCTPAVNGSDVEWVLNGVLSAGASGEVSFKVLIDN